MTNKYIWLILKFLISGIILYVMYIDIIFIIGYDELEKITKMDTEELMTYTPELGLFNLGFFAFAGFSEFILFFGKVFLFFVPFLIIILNVILTILIFLAVLIFKEKLKILIVSSAIIFICIMLLLSSF
ncbi:hypothetical protein [Malaciobacter marinus]|uniref:hypothetical protein n=1 Tax=Malaciobacter marinus TaxID=505249 RepID=UPI0009A7490D|nr:hypothetical protein [Malaciobacter marinus]SKB51011.1 hypothetical protein SAMN06295997_1168 [Malaciobacter marinus]